MAITSITNVNAAAAKAFIDNLGFTGITTELQSDALQVKADGATILSYNSVYYNNGGLSFNIASNYAKPTYTVTACSNGLILTYANSADIFISLNSDGTIIYGSNYSGDSGKNFPRVCRPDLANYLSNEFTRHKASCTALVNFVTNAGLGDANVAAENAYYIPIYQYDGTGIITLNNEKYITNGYWCIKD